MQEHLLEGRSPLFPGQIRINELWHAVHALYRLTSAVPLSSWPVLPLPVPGAPPFTLKTLRSPLTYHAVSHLWAFVPAIPSGLLRVVSLENSCSVENFYSGLLCCAS